MKVYELPRSDYKLDQTDDLYHFGVSVEAYTPEHTFVHRVPTGVVVCVATNHPTKDHMLRFMAFVDAVTELGEAVTGLKVPAHIRLKWQSSRERKDLPSDAE